LLMLWKAGNGVLEGTELSHLSWNPKERRCGEIA